MNKFYSSEDPSFKLLYPTILQIAQGADEILYRRRNPKAIPTDESSTSGDLKKCLQEMTVRNPEDVLSDIKRQKGERVGHTCEWILKRQEFYI
ncbi:NACHT and Ankyrin domain protein [Beauveria brongniartii RCEF 3172]|uniref:NACHT and Ankyrin domain protein n=1 Tax=Beauveria brongniartii RCEF 3172 TaxID=1081107 RepID=A0A166VS69_9HYPO|nr:NACHT and Ankyrin domain protein [Beauveria brongniartii RCEF 3172]